ncbi:RNA recognition motif domain-containing protein, putative [Eimeria brunetti]|uniref:RNA recognition motif domain-containing protein, putative n=1 Tax=Eimeria brunetti TaxID=51314 RepID=U6LST9_9EIME|nr:RNA recognition motif domain-containing protein, putative [Eimeria brunetti]
MGSGFVGVQRGDIGFQRLYFGPFELPVSSVHSPFSRPKGSLAFADAAIRALHGSLSLEGGASALVVKYAAGEAARLGLSAAAADGGIDKAKLFVGSIPRGATEEDLRAFFRAFGSVEEVFILRDSSSSSKGCAFIKYKYKEEALHAIRTVSGRHTFKGCSRPVDVRFAETKVKQPLQQLQQQLLLQQQHQHQQQQLLLQQQQLGLQPHPARFSPLAAAAAVAAKNFNPRQAGPWREYFTSDCMPYYHNETNNVTTWEKPPDFDALCGVGSSSSSSSSSSRNGCCMQTGTDPTGPPGANIFIFHIPKDWGRQQLLSAFGGFGAVVSCYVALDKESGKNKGFGFVSYTTPAAAAAAVNAMNNCVVSNKRLNVSIKKGEEKHAALHLLSPAATQQATKRQQHQHQQHQQQQQQQQQHLQLQQQHTFHPQPQHALPQQQQPYCVPAVCAPMQQQDDPTDPVASPAAGGEAAASRTSSSEHRSSSSSSSSVKKIGTDEEVGQQQQQQLYAAAAAAAVEAALTAAAAAEAAAAAVEAHGLANCSVPAAQRCFLHLRQQHRPRVPELLLLLLLLLQLQQEALQRRLRPRWGDGDLSRQGGSCGVCLEEPQQQQQQRQRQQQQQQHIRQRKD